MRQFFWISDHAIALDAIDCIYTNPPGILAFGKLIQLDEAQFGELMSHVTLLGNAPPSKAEILERLRNLVAERESAKSDG